MNLTIEEVVTVLTDLAKIRGMGWQTSTDIESITYVNPGYVAIFTSNKTEEKRLAEELDDEKERANRLEDKLGECEDELVRVRRELKAYQGMK